MTVLAQVVVSGLLLGGVYALISVGLTVIFGVVRIVNFAHGACVMFAMYATYWMHRWWGLDPYLAALVVTPLFFVVGLVLYRVVFVKTIGRPHAVQIFASVGLLIVLENLALVFWGADFRAVRTWAGGTWSLAGVNVPIGLLIAFLVSLAAGLGLLLVVGRTRFGKSMRAVTQDRIAATMMGISPRRMYAWAFGIGIACTGLAGALLTPLYTVYPLAGVQYGLVAFVIVVLGGMGSLSGAIVGGLVIGLIEALAGFYVSPAFQQLAYFVVFIGILLARPDGLFGRPGAAEIGEEVA